MAKRILVKLGGGLITHKDELCAPRLDVIDACAKAIAKLQDAGWSPIIVHGAGGFGHQRAKQFQLSDGMNVEIEGQEEAVELVREEMLILNSLVCQSLIKQGLRVASFPPHVWAKGTDANFSGSIDSFYRDDGIIPVTFGDVTERENELLFGILSGDHLMEKLSEIEGVSKAIFALNGIDGLMSKPVDGELISRLSSKSEFITHHDTDVDVTGGIGLKVDCAKSMARNGLEVWLLDGTKPERLIEAVIDGMTIGTLVESV